MGGWVQKMSISADLDSVLYSCCFGGRMVKKTPQKFTDVIYGWSLTKFALMKLSRPGVRENEGHNKETLKILTLGVKYIFICPGDLCSKSSS